MAGETAASDYPTGTGPGTKIIFIRKSGNTDLPDQHRNRRPVTEIPPANPHRRANGSPLTRTRDT